MTAKIYDLTKYRHERNGRFVREKMDSVKILRVDMKCRQCGVIRNDGGILYELKNFCSDMCLLKYIWETIFNE